MKTTGKILIFLALLFSATMATGQDCKTVYLNKADELYSKRKYEEAKKNYENYKTCAPGLPMQSIDEKIARCECEIKLQQGDALFSQNKCADAVRFYQDYQKCNPKAIGIDEKISKCKGLAIKNISKKKKVVVLDRYCGIKVSKKDMLNVYEERKSGNTTTKQKIGKLKVTSINGDVVTCKCTSGKDAVYDKFKSHANLLIDK